MDDSSTVRGIIKRSVISVVWLLGLAFSPTVKTVEAKFFNVNKTTTKVCRNKKKPVSKVLCVTE